MGHVVGDGNTVLRAFPSISLSTLATRKSTVGNIFHETERCFDFQTFHVSIWTAIVCIIVSSPILLTVMKTKGRIKMKILADNYIHVWGIYCQQGLSGESSFENFHKNSIALRVRSTFPEFPKENSMRLAFLSIFASALITVAAYSASLISYLTISTVNLPFSTVEGFVADGSYQLIVLKNSADYDSIMVR